MLITCPSCTTAYAIEAADLGASGRAVRCVRCKTLWHAAPPAMAETSSMAGHGLRGGSDMDDDVVDAFRAELAGQPSTITHTDSPGIADDGAPPDDAAAPAGQGGTDPDQPADASWPAAPIEVEPPANIPAADAPPLAPVLEHAPQSKPRTASNAVATPGGAPADAPRPRKRIRRPGPALVAPALIVALLAGLATLLLARHAIVAHAPQTASLYAAIGLPVNLRSLDFIDVVTTSDTHEGVPVLVVEGSIVNRSRGPVEVPRLRFGVVNDSGSEIYAWTAQPSQPILPGGATLPFRSRLASPPPEGRSILVRFFHRNDAASGLR